jgi:hypothetical protein
MKLMKIFLVVIIGGMIFACTSAQDKAYKSQEAVNKERLELINKYKECMKKAEKNKEKEAECEQYLKAADALK